MKTYENCDRLGPRAPLKTSQAAAEARRSGSSSLSASSHKAASLGASQEAKDIVSIT